jgi:dATP pyrophosphohydrolase
VRYDTLVPNGNRKRPESVLVIVYTPDQKTLLLRRAGNPFWQSVTGSLLWDEEHPETAARREVEEETGIVSTSGWHDWRIARSFMILPDYRYRYGPGITHNREHVFSLELPEIRDVQLNPREHTAGEWIAMDDALQRLWSWTNRTALTQLMRELV